MKILLVILVTLAGIASAQNVAVLFPNRIGAELRALNPPAGWPMEVVEIGTNTSYANTNFVVMTRTAKDDFQRTNRTAFLAWRDVALENYYTTNRFAVAERAATSNRLAAVVERETLFAVVTNTAITAINATTVVSNLVRLRILEERIK